MHSSSGFRRYHHSSAGAVKKSPFTAMYLLLSELYRDIFRIYAPEAPYSESDQLQEIFMFLIRELKGLGDPDGPSFKRYFYLLEVCEVILIIAGCSTIR
jgi:hypothetical protein